MSTDAPLFFCEQHDCPKVYRGETRACPACEVSALLTEREKELRSVRSENERLRGQLDGYAETEAMICPEDWGFAEYVKHLEAKVEGLRQQVEDLNK